MIPPLMHDIHLESGNRAEIQAWFNATCSDWCKECLAKAVYYQQSLFSNWSLYQPPNHQLRAFTIDNLLWILESHVGEGLAQPSMASSSWIYLARRGRACIRSLEGASWDKFVQKICRSISTTSIWSSTAIEGIFSFAIISLQQHLLRPFSPVFTHQLHPNWWGHVWHSSTWQELEANSSRLADWWGWHQTSHLKHLQEKSAVTRGRLDVEVASKWRKQTPVLKA